MTTERYRQEHTAFATCETVYRYHFICENDSFTFSAIAPTEAGAFRVLNAERPGTHARYTDRTVVPCAPLAMRKITCAHCRNRFVTVVGNQLCGKCHEERVANQKYNAVRAEARP